MHSVIAVVIAAIILDVLPAEVPALVIYKHFSLPFVVAFSCDSREQDSYENCFPNIFLTFKNLVRHAC